MEYMVIIGHWIDQNWQLQKCVLNFVHIPPHQGLEIAYVIWRYSEDCDIQSKIYTIYVDNASANGSTIYYLKIYAQRKKKLLCDENLFHVICCAHILNLIAQDGSFETKSIVDVIRDNIEYVQRSDASTFKDILPRFAAKDPHYDDFPYPEDRRKNEKSA
ncbi:UNVERIFIED_CONTAM: hypothetical protein Slati_1927700 [Sesamum latifolium]|uniref:Uncharacterized protein n=1 Tax=Sesamum latifolium TaxID=2727402 RepID=A0AAW2X2T4_9LAMI